MAYAAAKTLGDVRDGVLRRLGDTTATPAASRIWSESYVEGLVQDGARDLAIQTRLFWDMRFLDDLPFTGNYTSPDELAFFNAGEEIHNVFYYTATDELDYQSDGLSPANHTDNDERDFFIDSDFISAVERLPDSLYQVDRVTWDRRKMEPMQSRTLQRRDAYYETIRGDALGYLQDKDGLRTLRKYRPPAGRCIYYPTLNAFGSLKGFAADITLTTITLRMHIDQWAAVFGGVLDSAISVLGDGFMPPAGVGDFALVSDALITSTEFSGYLGLSRDGYGILRRLPGYHPSNGPWGFAKQLSQDSHNTKVEFYRRPRIPQSSKDIFEFPNYMLKYIRHYALWQAYERGGVGQDLKMAAHYKARYQLGVARAKSRVERSKAARLVRMGGTGPTSIYPGRPYARLPRNVDG